MEDKIESFNPATSFEFSTVLKHIPLNLHIIIALL